MWTHTLQVVDEAAGLLGDLADDRPRQLAVMLGALCHDLGKPATTRFEDGRIRSRGHEEAGLPPADVAPRPLGRAHAPRLRRARAGPGAGGAPPQARPALTTSASSVSDGAIRRLSRKCEPDLLYRVAKADCLGRRPGDFEPVAMEWFREKVQRARRGACGRPSRSSRAGRSWRSASRRARRSGRVAAGRLRAAARRGGHDARGGRGRGPSHPRRQRWSGYRP